MDKLESLKQDWLKANRKDRKIIEYRAKLLKYAQEEREKNLILFEEVKKSFGAE